MLIGNLHINNPELVILSRVQISSSINLLTNLSRRIVYILNKEDVRRTVLRSPRKVGLNIRRSKDITEAITTISIIIFLQKIVRIRQSINVLSLITVESI